jgi:hypothetical protein
MPARQFCRVSRNANPIARLLIPSSWMASPGWDVGRATATPAQTNEEHSTGANLRRRLSVAATYVRPIAATTVV